MGDVAFISVNGSSIVAIKNLELDGNLSHLILGGLWGDTVRQIAAYGLLIYNNSNVYISKINSHHNALDGIAIGYSGLKENNPATPYTLADCNFEYNGRQGLSWVGGRNLKAYRCKFSHTGKALNNGTPLNSAPGAGLDIEAEDSVTRDGYFEDCEFIDNVGPGMVADSGNGGYTTFKNCTFWGTTNWSLWSKKPGLKYEDCKIYGSAVHAIGSPDPKLATNWTNCTFEDKPWTDGKVYRANSGSTLFEVNGNLQNVLLKNCSFVANTCRSIWASATADGPITFDGCTITHKKADLTDHDFLALFRKTHFIGCHFTESFEPDVTGTWFIQAEATNIAADPPTIVDGSHVKWQNWSWGKTGSLPATQFQP